MLCRAISKLVMMAAGDQLKTSCGSLKLCAGLEAGIDGETHTVSQRRQKKHLTDPEGGVDEA